MHVLLTHVPPFWQVVLPHLFLQLVTSIRLNTPKVSKAIIIMLPMRFKMNN
jgi:hypothetical protein